MNKQFVPLLAILTLSLSSLAQQNIDSVYVSATRLKVKKIEAGKNITLISAKEIKQLPVTSVDELLQYVAGINTNSRNGFGVQSDIGMRGSTFSQILILVDNQRINDPLTAHFNNNIPIPMSEIDHIEVVRGSAAVSYGADAVGGIIHIKTKTYEGLNNPGSFSFDGNMAIGQNNLTLTDVGFHQQNQKFGYSAAIKTTSSAGEQLVNPNYIGSGLGDSLYNNYFDLKTYTAALTYKTGNWKLYARGGSDFRDFAAKYYYTASAYDESLEQVNAYWTQGAAIYNAANSTTEFNISYRNNNDSFAFNPLFPSNVHTTQRTNATLNHTRVLGKTEVAFGGQFDQQDIVSTDRGDHSLSTQALFALANKKFNNLYVNGGVRLEYSENINLQLVPQLNLSYLMNGYVLRSSIGRSIRQADFTERYVSYLIPNLSAGRNAGNPDLEAESAYTLDIGVDVNKSEKLQWTNTLFLRQSSNLIDYVNTNSNDITNLTNLKPSTTYMYATNISESFTWGDELSVKYRAYKGEKAQVNTQLNYTYINTSTPDSVLSKYIANHPIHNVNAIVNIGLHRFNWLIGASLITRNEETIDAIDAEIKPNYTLINSKISYSSSIVPVKLYVEVRNALNIQYQEILGAKMPSRWVYGGLTWVL